MSAANCFWTKMFVAIPNRDERADRVGDRAAIQRGQSIQVSVMFARVVWRYPPTY